MTRSRHRSAEARPRRILHVLPWVASGGVERTRLTLARGLPRQRFEQRIVCIAATSPLVDRVRAEGVRVDVVPGRWTVFDVRALGAIRELVRAYDPDLVHGAVFEGVAMASLATIGRRARLVVEEIDYPVTRTFLADRLFAALAYRADRCVAVSPSVREYLVRKGVVENRRISVIPNGVEQPIVPGRGRLAELRAALRIPAGAFVVGSVGRLSDAHKRFSDLIRALARLEQDLPSLHLLLVGDGPDRVSLEGLARELGVADRVSFAGYQEDVGAMYGLMDVFALVSNRESFGLVLAEAMYVGLPVICSGVGGMRDVVVEGENGVYVGVGDIGAIARAILGLFRDPRMRQTIGERNERRVDALFSAAEYCARVAALYDELLGR